jgi:hypothetical protein
VCGANGKINDAAVASAKCSASGEAASRLREASLTSSMTAAIAVLNANRPAMSFVTLSIAQWALRTNSRSSPDTPLNEAGDRAPARSASSADSRHSRLRKRYTPSSPSSDQSASWSGGPMKRMYARMLSAP